MEWNIIYELIDSRLVIVVAASWVIGFTLKKTPFVPDWSIVYIISLFSILFTGLLLGWSAESVIQGILAGAVAVYGNQLVKQTHKRVSDQDE